MQVLAVLLPSMRFMVSYKLLDGKPEGVYDLYRVHIVTAPRKVTHIHL